MRQFITKALQKFDKLSTGQMRDLVVSSAKEIDRLETVLDSLPRGILVCDTSHNLILANKAARRLLSIITYEQGREKIWAVIPEELIAEFLAHTLLSADKAEEREFEVETNNKRKLLSVSVMPMVQDRQVSGSLVLIDDITERRGREARMRRMESLASLTSLAAGVAHEIKNPLGSLSIHVQLIQKALAVQEKLCLGLHQPEKTESGQASQSESGLQCEPGMYFGQISKYLSIINEEVDRLNGIVVDFLFAVRPLNAELRRGNINSLISDLVNFVSFEMAESGIELSLNLNENLPGPDFDEKLMKQALLNLIKNSAAAMCGGGKLTISTGIQENDIVISIADTGTGISEENLSKIFEPYFTTKEDGTGLGLTLVFKIVKEHQGEINVKSVEGEGTVIEITLPIPQVERKLIAYETPEVSSRAAADAFGEAALTPAGGEQ